jgi:hypothetical protein
MEPHRDDTDLTEKQWETLRTTVDTTRSLSIPGPFARQPVRTERRKTGDDEKCRAFCSTRAHQGRLRSQFIHHRVILDEMCCGHSLLFLLTKPQTKWIKAHLEIAR